MGTGGVAHCNLAGRPGYRGGYNYNRYYAAAHRRRDEERRRHEREENDRRRRAQACQYRTDDSDSGYEQSISEAQVREQQAEREEAERQEAEREQARLWELGRPAREKAAREQAEREQIERKRIEGMVVAVKKGDLEALKAYTYFDFVNYIEPGKSLLSIAVTEDQQEVIKYLIDQTVSKEKVELSMQVKKNFLDAIRSNNIEMVTIYLGQNRLCDLTIASQSAPLYLAASKGHLMMVKLLLTANAPINHVNKPHFLSDHYTASHIAAKNEHKEVFEFLVKQGANIDIPARWVTAREIANVKIPETLKSFQNHARQIRSLSAV